MPIALSSTVRLVSQQAFGQTAYRVVGNAFEIHRRLGPLFREPVYRSTLAHVIHGSVVEELKIRVTHGHFQKDLFVDLLVDESGPFELKVVEALTDEHRSQLMQYLMLLGISHGKLINFGAESLEHEFVNCNIDQSQRKEFAVLRCRWPPERANKEFESLLIGLVRDWGTGLQRSLYTEAISGLIGRELGSVGMVSTHWNGAQIQTQPFHLIENDVAWVINCQPSGIDGYRSHLHRLLNNTHLNSILWANITIGHMRLEMIDRDGSAHQRK